jgi:hypothetical protein
MNRKLAPSVRVSLERAGLCEIHAAYRKGSSIGDMPSEIG